MPVNPSATFEVRRPGLGLPLDYYMSNGPLDDPEGDVFPSALVDEHTHWRANTITTRERGMLWFINLVTEKPNWTTDVFDDAVVARWRAELDWKVSDVVAREEEGEEQLYRVLRERRLAQIERRRVRRAARRAAREAVLAEQGPAAVQVEAAIRGNRRRARMPSSDESDGTPEEDSDTGPTVKSTTKVDPLRRGFSNEMFDYCIAELRDKATIHDKHGIVSVFDGAGAVFKTDGIPPTLRKALQSASERLEASPDTQDFREGFGGARVRDLIDPSLWPLVYGRTRVLRDRDLTRETCLEAFGSRETIPPAPHPHGPRQASGGEEHDTSFSPLGEAAATEETPDEARHANTRLLSYKFQWLPCEVEVDHEGAHITSYINNLHPVQHSELYTAVEGVLTKTLPLLDAVYDRVMTWDTTWSDELWPLDRWGHGREIDEMSSDPRWQTRIVYEEQSRLCLTPGECSLNDRGICGWHYTPENKRLDERMTNTSDSEEMEKISAIHYTAWQRYEEQWETTHPWKTLEPREYQYLGHRDYRLAGPWFNGKRHLQVIVKMVTITLSPDSPSYPGGQWHVEGTLNERICASSLYYYDMDNITETRLAFRTVANGERIPDHFGCRPGNGFGVYGFDIPASHMGPIVQDLGSIQAREGRLIAFPNAYQHRIEPFQLADNSRPGHRKILAIFLVDPATPIVSTANVPPQQRHWGSLHHLDTSLPPELRDVIYDDLGAPFDRREAFKLRRQLMEERDHLCQTSANINRRRKPPRMPAGHSD